MIQSASSLISHAARGVHEPGGGVGVGEVNTDVPDLAAPLAELDERRDLLVAVGDAVGHCPRSAVPARVVAGF